MYLRLSSSLDTGMSSFLKTWSLCLASASLPKDLIWLRIHSAIYSGPFLSLAACAKGQSPVLSAPGHSSLLITTPPCIHVLFNPRPDHQVASQGETLWGVVTGSLFLRSTTPIHLFFLFSLLIPPYIDVIVTFCQDSAVFIFPHKSSESFFYHLI